MQLGDMILNNFDELHSHTCFFIAQLGGGGGGREMEWEGKGRGVWRGAPKTPNQVLVYC